MDLTATDLPAPGGAAASVEIDAQFKQLAISLTQTLRSLSAGVAPPAALLAAKQEHSLQRRHMLTLLTVTLAGPFSVSALASQLRLGLSTTSALVGDLSRAGLLERHEDDRDRRRTIVRLDGRHSDEITAWAQTVLAPLRRTLELLSPAARAQFIGGWELLHEQAMLAAERRTAPAESEPAAALAESEPGGPEPGPAATPAAEQGGQRA
jgi:DNA-binding MarR family transcriptional regulator